MWAALALCAVLLVAAAHLPGFADLLRLEGPGLRGWLVVIGVGAVPLLVGQIALVLGRVVKARARSTDGAGAPEVSLGSSS